MVAGHLQEKKGLFYIVLNYYDANNKRKQSWFPTGLPTKGNKKRAEKMLLEMRQSFIPSVLNSQGDTLALSPDMLYADFMVLWLQIIKTTVRPTTYSAYQMTVHKKIAPYFRKLNISLRNLEARHIQSFYLEELKYVSASTVIHEHANVHKALKYAVKMDLIPSNPADKVERPKAQKYLADYYKSEELEELFECTKSHKMSMIIQVTAFYGLRRSEAVGLKWSAFDFEKNTVSIRHTVTSVPIDGVKTLIQADSAKTASSLRTLPLIEGFREKLLAMKERQEEYRKICGNSYNQEFLEYIFVDELGNLMKPDYVTSTFTELLKKNGLRKIRFHDLRHSCASLLLAHGVSMKEIQDWLGHSDIATTSNIYAHLDYSSKVSSAEVLTKGLAMPADAKPKNAWVG